MRSASRSTVVLVLPERWLRQVIRAKLAARGHQVVELADLGALAAFRPDRARHGALRLVLVDENAVHGAGAGVLERVRARHRGVPLVLLQSWMTGQASGPWSAVIPRVEPDVELLDRLALMQPFAPAAAG
jgi:hypothetical protein